MTITQQPASAAIRSTRFADLAAIAAIVVLWWLWLAPGVVRLQPVAFDTFRDTAGVENVLAGRWLRDPITPGQSYWYAPLGPIIFAGISRLAGCSAVAVYSGSILWLNVFLPITWYLLARMVWDRRAAIAAVPVILFGSLWWTTHAPMPMTSIQGALLATIAMIAWLASLQRRRRWAAAVGVLLAFCAWYHTLSALIASAAIGLHAVAGAETHQTGHAAAPRLSGRREALIRMALAGGVCILLASPLIRHLLNLPRQNLHPVEYLANELRDPRYALQSGSLLVLPLAVIGAASTYRRLRGPDGLVLAYAIVTLVGQVLGYIRMFTGVDVPVLIPHEFQWHFQAAVGMFAARGAVASAEWLAKHLSGRLSAWASRPDVLLAVTVAVVVGPAIPRAVFNDPPDWKAVPAARADEVWETVEWIKQHTSIDEVFLGHEPTDFFLIAGLTGRKLQCPPAGHASIAVSADVSARDQAELFETELPARFRELLHKYGVAYVVLDGDRLGLWERWRGSGILEPAFRSSSGFLNIFSVQSQRPMDPAAKGP